MQRLFGREPDIAVLSGHLVEHRLVTVVGPGGVGKTSVARALVEDRESVIVELSAIAEVDDLGERIAQRSGVDSVDALVDWLAGQSCVLVLDTCEHVVEGAAALAQRVMHGAPSCRVLATSRVPLDLPDEIIHVLQPLSIDQRESEPAAVSMFIDRAKAAGAPAGALADREAIRALCERLDGMPLAIELAAARTRTVSAAEIMRHLDDGVEVLSRPRYRGESRHRSVRATIDWSVRLLDPATQRLLRRLAVFPATFDADLAHATAGEPEHSPLDTSDLLRELVDHSLLSSRASLDGLRFVLFDTTRAYAEADLDRSGETADVQDAYIDAVCGRAASLMERDGDDWQIEDLRAVIDLVDDFVHAVELAFDDDSSDRAFAILLVLWAAAPMSRSAEIARVGLAALERWPTTGAPMWADVVATTATALRECGRIDEAERLASHALDHTETSFFAAVSLRRILALCIGHEDPIRAAELARDAIAAARELGAEPFARELELFLAQILVTTGDVEEALMITRAAIQVTSPHEVNHLWARVVEGMADLIGDEGAGEDGLVLAHRLSERVGYVFGVGSSLRLLALSSIDAERFDIAAQRVLDLLDHVRSTRNLGEQGCALLIGCAVLRAVDHPDLSLVIEMARGWSWYETLASGDLRDLRVPDTNTGRTVAPGEALTRCRAALEGIADAGQQPSPSAQLTAPDDQATVEASLIRTGELWTATFDDASISLRHSKGLIDIVALLASPGREIHILDLVDAAVVERSVDDVVDQAGMDAYRRRILELQDELDEADHRGDAEASERARGELDSLVDQLAAAGAVGGRPRRTTSTAERARSAVTKRIRQTIKRIDSVHPTLGRHLDASISTGLYCVYDPERSVRWELRD